MGFLKKMQAANADDAVSEVPDEVPDLPHEAGSASAAPAEDQSSGQRHFHRPGRHSNDAKASANATPAEGGEGPSAQREKEDDQLKPDEPELDEDHFPPALHMLRELLRTHDWHHEQSDDANVRANGQVEWTIIAAQMLNAVDAGYERDVRQLWARYAPKEHRGLADLLGAGRYSSDGGGSPPRAGSALRPLAEPEAHLPEPYIPFYDPRNDSDVIDADAYVVPDAPFTDPFQKPDWAKRPKPGVQSVHQALDPASEQAPVQGQSGGVSTDLLSKALTAPFALSAAAGSLVLNSLKAMGDKAKSFYVKNRVNGHAVLAQQLDQKAADIESLTSTLKKQGMGSLIDDMRATGRPAREIFDGMKEGGAHQHFRDRFNTLMGDPLFAETYGRLEGALDDFNFKATRYAQTGIELNLDYSDAIDRNLEKISAATEGFVFNKDGVIKHMQELARQIGERIANLVNNLMGRLAPQ
ncbi:hypothetical protein M4D49_26990 [Cupriavidus pauculus]|uniref:hypothetical protein n=1 Tax=Burkholderiaceae TaxID=119060 RepID=UPI000493037C|nr:MULTISPECIES: hypothetical protein [Burkholderiaceae]MCM3609134.1 hypothetical protein [Cupriavidus pauculus]